MVTNSDDFYPVIYLVWPHIVARFAVAARGWADGHVRSLKKPILSILVFSNFPLNLLTVSQVTQSSLSWFHLSITLSEKKYFRRFRLHLCFTNFTECPLVRDIVIL